MESFLFLLLVAGVFAVAIWIAREKNRKLSEAKTAYQRSLAVLKSDPTNADVKQHTLALGREYSNLTRNSKGVSLFDEVALSNDISAACAGATRRSAPVSQGSLESRLARLADLQSQGLLSAQEFQEQRSRILQEL